MKTIIVKTDAYEEFPDDVGTIVAALAAQGLDCTRSQAVSLWEAYSMDRCAGWLMMSNMSADDICDALMPYFDVL